jgi:hypothetical protein
MSASFRVNMLVNLIRCLSVTVDMSFSFLAFLRDEYAFKMKKSLEICMASITGSSSLRYPTDQQVHLMHK